jgi:zinc transport system substrate-binding protein
MRIVFMSGPGLRALVVPLCATFLAGCGGGEAADRPGTSVVAGAYPFAYLAERVAGRHVELTNLTPPGAEPHDLELTPRQVAVVAEADLVVYDRGFQPAMDDAVTQHSTGARVEVAHVVATAPGHADGAALADDPHIWLDPTKLVPVATNIARRLARLDPANAADYRHNAAALVRDLQALDRDFMRGIDECLQRPIVTSHAAFGHLAARYDLRMVPITGLEPTAEPSPQRLARLERVAEKHDVTTIFSETLVSPAIARTLANEVGVRTAVLDPIEGLTAATADEDYFSLMRANLAAIRSANCT